MRLNEPDQPTRTRLDPPDQAVPNQTGLITRPEPTRPDPTQPDLAQPDLPAWHDLTRSDYALVDPNRPESTQTDPGLAWPDWT